MRTITSTNTRAFTVIELMVVVVICMIGIMLLVPTSHGNKQKAGQINCVNNLKQVGLAFRMWAGDNGDVYPMQYKTNGFNGAEYANSKLMYVYFQVMANEFTTPKILFCPEEKKRTAATNFTSDFNSGRVSYFVGLDSREDLPQSFLAGDRNLGEATGESKYIPPAGYGYSDKSGGSYVVLGTNIAWSDKLHQRQGNITMGDGSVQKLSTSGVRKALQNTGLQTNRLVFP